MLQADCKGRAERGLALGLGLQATPKKKKLGREAVARSEG